MRLELVAEVAVEVGPAGGAVSEATRQIRRSPTNRVVEAVVVVGVGRGWQERQQQQRPVSIAGTDVRHPQRRVAGLKSVRLPVQEEKDGQARLTVAVVAAGTRIAMGKREVGEYEAEGRAAPKYHL
jgi:hypothetical protein